MIVINTCFDPAIWRTVTLLREQRAARLTGASPAGDGAGLPGEVRGSQANGGHAGAEVEVLADGQHRHVIGEPTAGAAVAGVLQWSARGCVGLV